MIDYRARPSFASAPLIASSTSLRPHSRSVSWSRRKAACLCSEKVNTGCELATRHSKTARLRSLYRSSTRLRLPRLKLLQRTDSRSWFDRVVYNSQAYDMDCWAARSSGCSALLPPASPWTAEHFQISGLFLFPGVAFALRPTSACSHWLLGFDLVQNGHQVLFKRHRILAHREVTNFFHDDALRSFDLLSRLARHLWGTSEVVDARHEVDRHRARNLGIQLPEVVVHAIEVQVSFEDARSPLTVIPPRLPAVIGWALGCH